MAAMPGVPQRYSVDGLFTQSCEKIAAIGHNARRLMSKRRPFTDQDASLFHWPGQARKAEIIAEADDHPARPLPRLFAGRRRAGAGDRRGPLEGLRLYVQGSMVAVISNGTAILGLGDLGALASSR